MMSSAPGMAKVSKGSKNTDWMIRISRRARLAILTVGSILCLIEIQFKPLDQLWSRLSIRTTRALPLLSAWEYTSYWFGVELLQTPNDLLTFANLVFRVQPDVIIETGTYNGGSAIYFATLLEKINPDGKVITVDLDSERWDRTLEDGRVPKALISRIVFIQGNSVSDSVLNRIEIYTRNKRGLVFLDSAHGKDHVVKELRLYSRFVTHGSYLIVHDTLTEALWTVHNPGPLAAIREFLAGTQDFEIDHQLPERVLSLCPSGFLKRVK
jgi:cephalosporin hydroxylase